MSIINSVEIDVFNDDKSSQNCKNTKSFVDQPHDMKSMNKTSNLSGCRRNLSNSRLHDRSKSNVNENRHFQIKHEPTSFNSLETYQRLMNNFPDIRCSSTENLKTVDRETIDRRASELKKYMSSGCYKGKRENCKSSRDVRDMTYGQDKNFDKILGALSDSKIDFGEDEMHKTSIIVDGVAVCHEPQASMELDNK